MGGENLFLAFSCIITQIFLAVRVQELPVIDQFIEQKNTTDLGLIREVKNPMTRQAKQATTLLAQAMQSIKQ